MWTQRQHARPCVAFRELDLTDDTIHITRWGDSGPRVVLIHGGMQGSKSGGDRHFMAQSQLGENGWQVLAPDRPGHGLPAAICAELIRSRGFVPFNLGADSPVDTIIRAAESTDQLRALVLSTVSSTPESVIVDVVNQVHSSLPHTPVLVGGIWPGLPEEVISVNGFPSMLVQLGQLGG